ncbi:hypothetical protein ACFQ1I_12805 [Kitasatospora arboriphila]
MGGARLPAGARRPAGPRRRLSDTVGRKTMYLGGFAVFALASLAAASPEGSGCWSPAGPSRPSAGR